MAIPTDLPRLPPRAPDAHKGTFGRVLVIAGSVGMSGAAVLSGSAALRGGAGLVRVACPFEIQSVVATWNPCYTTVGWPDHWNYAIESALRLVAESDAVAIGPGLGTVEGMPRFVRRILTDSMAIPMVVDADALNVLAGDSQPWPMRSGPTIVTPHPGEFARMIRASAKEVQANRDELARQFAVQNRVVVLLKGHRTVITDGTSMRWNTTGNPGMATGGSGDVLTGLIAALLGQGMNALDAATLGAWVHGRAGDLAAAELSQVALTAADLLDYLPRVFRELETDHADSIGENS